jgi:hypothetical protein
MILQDLRELLRGTDVERVADLLVDPVLELCEPLLYLFADFA